MNISDLIAEVQKMSTNIESMYLLCADEWVYLHQARHFSFLKWSSNGGSERFCVFHWSSFQEVFSCLVDVYFNHFPFELEPLGNQYL